ncbi:MAG: response regulator transcription factor [Phycisphaerales bacterium]|nr:MAG: response regulator transcription factor [Phycisphaerales bacterium]
MVPAEKQNASNDNRKKVLIVDDHPIFREGLADLINRQDDMEVCGMAKDVPQTLKALKKLKPDILTVDISLAASSGLELMKDIRIRFPGLPMLALSMHQESIYAERAIRAGAKGYITKQEASKKVIAAIRKVLEGRLYLSDEMKEELLFSMIGSNGSEMVSSPVDRLTDRELEVFQLLGQGKGTAQIADQLCLSAKTIETYRSRIKEKLNLKGGSELMRCAFQWASTQDKAWFPQI